MSKNQIHICLIFSRVWSGVENIQHKFKILTQTKISF